MPAPLANFNHLLRTHETMHHIVSLRERLGWAFDRIATRFNYPSPNAAKLSYYRFKRHTQSQLT